MVVKKRIITINRKKTLVKVEFRRGFFEAIQNPKGKGNVAIVQRGDFTGFTALSGGIKGKRIDRSRSAEKLALRLIKRGKKNVRVFD